MAKITAGASNSVYITLSSCTPVYSAHESYHYLL